MALTESVITESKADVLHRFDTRYTIQGFNPQIHDIVVTPLGILATDGLSAEDGVYGSFRYVLIAEGRRKIINEIPDLYSMDRQSRAGAIERALLNEDDGSLLHLGMDVFEQHHRSNGCTIDFLPFVQRDDKDHGLVGHVVVRINQT